MNTLSKSRKKAAGVVFHVWGLAAFLCLTVAAGSAGAAEGGGKDLETLWEQGQRALAAGELETASRAFNKALERDQNQPRTWNYLGGVYFEQGEYLDALSHFKQAFMLDPLDVRACNNIATSYEHLGQYEKAKSFYVKALQIDWQYPTTYRNLGVLYAYHLHKPDLARRFWERFIQLVPDGADSESVLAELAALKDRAAGEKGPDLPP